MIIGMEVDAEMIKEQGSSDSEGEFLTIAALEREKTSLDNHSDSKPLLV